MNDNDDIFMGRGGDWQERMAAVVETMREMSLQVDAQSMVRAYGARMRQIMPVDRWIGISRRELAAPKYRVTRSSTWKDAVDPWKQKDLLPVFEGGLLGELIYGDQPRVIDHLEVAPDDPAAEYLRGQRSLIAIPHYDRGSALNMVIWMRTEPSAFSREKFPEWVWLSNLFGRATHNLVLSEDLKRAYEIVERELKVVADIQRSLLPKTLPRIPTLDLAAHYQTSRWAGGDYYDIFALPDGKWGLLIADVSGHGTPAAVMMAITHSIAHSYPGAPDPPGQLLDFVNRQLATRYTANNEAFVTAFYGIYDPARRELTYASAGHNPPRLVSCADGSIASLDGVGSLPLGISAEERYEDSVQTLRPGDQLVFYTDGITEAVDLEGRMFGTERLDQVLMRCPIQAKDIITGVLEELEQFTAGQPAEDDRTLLVAKVS
jgi:sigma-B regulation protein RsbU (phosphoserine phosphatase)